MPFIWALFHPIYNQGIVGCTPIPTYPYGKSRYKPYICWVFMGHNPQESLKNAINTMGTLLGVHPIVPWYNWFLGPTLGPNPSSPYHHFPFSFQRTAPGGWSVSTCDLMLPAISAWKKTRYLGPAPHGESNWWCHPPCEPEWYLIWFLLLVVGGLYP